MGSWAELDARQRPDELTPPLVLLLALHYCADATHIEDGTVQTALEAQMQHNGIGGIPYETLLTQAATYRRTHALQDLLSAAPPLLTREQQLTILLNVADYVLADQQLTAEENNILSAFMEAFGFTHAEMHGYLMVLMLKNNLALFNPPSA